MVALWVDFMPFNVPMSIMSYSIGKKGVNFAKLASNAAVQAVPNLQYRVCFLAPPKS